MVGSTNQAALALTTARARLTCPAWAAWAACPAWVASRTGLGDAGRRRYSAAAVPAVSTASTAAHPLNTMITATAASAPAAATRAGPRSTLLAAAVQPRYTVRNSAVGTVTSCVVLTRCADAAAMTSRPVAAIAISSTGDGRPPPFWPAPFWLPPSRPARAVSDRAITAAPDR